MLLGYLAFINTLLLVFNLLPAFPLDGGNIVRAVAWWRTGDRLRATAFAARMGRVFAYAMIAGGVFVLVRYQSIIGGIWFIILGNFLAQAARGAEMQSRITSQLEGLSVADVMDQRACGRAGRDAARHGLRRVLPALPLALVPGHRPRRPLPGARDPREGRRRARVASAAAATVDEVMSRDAEGSLRVSTDAPLEALMGSEGLRTLGALMAVDRDGVFVG